MDYIKQVADFLAATGTTLDVKFDHHGKHFEGDKDTRDIYSVTLSRNSRKYEFKFGQSIASSTRYQEKNGARHMFTPSGKGIGNNFTHHKPETFKAKYGDYIEINGEAPTAYDILACITKHDPDTFENFCNEFGYDTDSKKAERTYNAVLNEYLNVSRLFNEAEMEQLQEIQ